MYEVNFYEVMVAFPCFCDEHMKVNVKPAPVHNEAQCHEGTLGE